MATAQKRERPEPTAQTVRQRILVPVSNLHSIIRLLDFAFAIKDPAVPDPVYPLAVISDVIDAPARIAEAETFLREARAHASGGDTATKLITRIDLSAAGGILRVIQEMRITCVVLGWGSERTPREYFFGSLHEHLLDRNTPMTFVNGIRSPLNTIKRMIVVLSPHSEHEYGLRQCLGTLYTLRRHLKIPVVFQGLPDYLEAVRLIIRETGEPAGSVFTTYESWDDMSVVFQQEMKTHDMTIFLTAREGSVAWNAGIEPFAKKTRRLVADANVVLLYAPAKPSMVGSELKVAESLFPGITEAETVGHEFARKGLGAGN